MFAGAERRIREITDGLERWIHRRNGIVHAFGLKTLKDGWYPVPERKTPPVTIMVPWPECTDHISRR